MPDEAIIPFGKYKGRRLDELMTVDRPYLDWLVNQPWFREKNPNLVTIIINGGAQPDADTPEHNRLQLRFLNPKLCDQLWLAVFKQFKHHPADIPRQIPEYREKITSRMFETKGWDLVLSSSMNRLCVELKPFIGDDFPAVLRTVNNRRGRDWEYRVAVVVETFNAESGSFEDVAEMFAETGIHLIRMRDIAQEM